MEVDQELRSDDMSGGGAWPYRLGMFSREDQWGDWGAKTVPVFCAM